MRIFITLILLCVASVLLPGCATTDNQPATHAAEESGSWTHQGVNQVGLSLDGIDVLKPTATLPGADGKTDPVTLGVDVYEGSDDGKPNPQAMAKAARANGGVFIYIDKLSQSVEGGADAKRAGTQSATSGNNDLDNTNAPKTDVPIDLKPGL